MKPKVRVVPISGLVLDDKNGTRGTKRGREMLGDSLRTYGAGRAVLVDLSWFSLKWRGEVFR